MQGLYNWTFGIAPTAAVEVAAKAATSLPLAAPSAKRGSSEIDQRAECDPEFELIHSDELDSESDDQRRRLIAAPTDDEDHRQGMGYQPQVSERLPSGCVHSLPQPSVQHSSAHQILFDGSRCCCTVLLHCEAAQSSLRVSSVSQEL